MAKLEKTRINESKKPSDDVVIEDENLEVIDELEDEVDEDELDVEDLEDEEDVELEESAASDTLKPNSMPVGAANKSAAIGKIINAVAGMDDPETINKFVATMELIGKEARNIPGDDAAKNKNTLNTKPSNAGVQLVTKLESVDDALSAVIKEDVTKLFEGEELTEEFKDKVSTLVESAINLKVNKRIVELEEEFEKRYEEELEEIIEELADVTDKYLEAAVSEWLDENGVAIESSLKNDLTEQFLEGLKALFETHYITVPEDRVDIVQEMADRIEALELSQSSVMEDNERLMEELTQALAREKLAEMSRGLAASESEKLSELAESVEFDTLDEFSEKLSVLREQYFGTEVGSQSVSSKKVLFEENEVLEEETTGQKVAGPMASYVNTLTRTIRK